MPATTKERVAQALTATDEANENQQVPETQTPVELTGEDAKTTSHWRIRDRIRPGANTPPISNFWRPGAAPETPAVDQRLQPLRAAWEGLWPQLSVEALAAGDNLQRLYAEAGALLCAVRRHFGAAPEGGVDTPRGVTWLDLRAQQPSVAPSATVGVEGELAGLRVLIVDEQRERRGWCRSVLENAGVAVTEWPHGAGALDAAARAETHAVIAALETAGLEILGLLDRDAIDPNLVGTPLVLIPPDRFVAATAAPAAWMRPGADALLRDAMVEATRPLANFRQALRADGPVSARIEDLGVTAALRCAAMERSACQVTLRDNMNLFEVALEDGRLVDVIRTANTGGFARGDAVLGPLVGVRQGELRVGPPVPIARKTVGDRADVALERGRQRLRALVDVVTRQPIESLSEIEFDGDVLEGFLRSAPPEQRDIARLLRATPQPAELVSNGRLQVAPLRETLRVITSLGAVINVRVARQITAPMRLAVPDAPVAVDAAAEQPEIDIAFDPVIAPAEPAIERAPALKPVLHIQDWAARASRLDDVNMEEDIALLRKARRPGWTGALRATASWLAVVGCSAALGFGAWRLAESRAWTQPLFARLADLLGSPAIAAPRVNVEPVPALPAAPAVAATEPPAAPAAEPIAAADPTALRDGDHLPLPANAAVPMEENQGLLELTDPGEGTEVQAVLVDGKDIGRPPQQVALTEGRHEIEFKRAQGASSYRFVSVDRSALTRVETP